MRLRFSKALLAALLLPGLAVANPATVTWTAVTLNTDGTACTNLAGYKVYRAQMSLVAGKWTRTEALHVIATVNTGTLKYVDLPAPGHYQYAVSGYTASAESDLAGPVEISIRLPAPTGGTVLPAPKGGVILPPQ